MGKNRGVCILYQGTVHRAVNSHIINKPQWAHPIGSHTHDMFDTWCGMFGITGCSFPSPYFSHHSDTKWGTNDFFCPKHMFQKGVFFFSFFNLMFSSYSSFSRVTSAMSARFLNYGIKKNQINKHRTYFLKNWPPPTSLSTCSPPLFCPTLHCPYPSSNIAEDSWHRYKASHSSDDSCLTLRQPVWS